MYKKYGWAWCVIIASSCSVPPRPTVPTPARQIVATATSTFLSFLFRSLSRSLSRSGIISFTVPIAAAAAAAASRRSLSCRRRSHGQYRLRPPHAVFSRRWQRQR